MLIETRRPWQPPRRRRFPPRTAAPAPPAGGSGKGQHHYYAQQVASMYKNTASQKLTLFVFDYSTGAPKTGDAGNLTAYVSKDDGSVTVLGDTSATELDSTNAKGLYAFDLTQAETNADKLVFSGKSSTANTSVVPLLLYTEPPGFSGLVINSGRANADLTHIVNTAVNTSAAQLGVNVVNAAGTAWASGAINAAVLASDTITDAKVASDVTIASVTGSVGSVTGNVGGNVAGSVGSIASGGISSSSFASGAIDAAAMNVNGSEFTAIPWNASWDAEVQSEVDDALVAQRLDELLNADSDIDGAAPPTVGSVFHELMTKTAGSFTYDQTTDSLEAIRDRGDAAWTTATGFSTHTAADVWAVGTRVLTAGTNIQLPSNGLANISAWTVNVTGSLSGSVGSVTGAVGSVTGNVGGNIVGSVGSLSSAALIQFIETDTTQLVGDVVAGSVAQLTASRAWEEAKADHTTADTFGDYLDDEITSRAASVLPKKNTAINNFEVYLVASSDHVTAATGATITATRSIDGGAFAACANSVSEVGSGVYKINLAASDLNGDVVSLRFTGTGVDTRVVSIVTQP